MKVDIVGLNKADVLLSLYNNASFAGEEYASQPMMNLFYRKKPFGNSAAAEAAIEKAEETGDFSFDYIDLGAGRRPLQVDLKGFDFDSRHYDLNHGHVGYAAKIINVLRTTLIEECKDDSMGHFLSRIGLVFKPKTDSEKPEDSSAQPPNGPST